MKGLGYVSIAWLDMTMYTLVWEMVSFHFNEVLKALTQLQARLQKHDAILSVCDICILVTVHLRKQVQFSSTISVGHLKWSILETSRGKGAFRIKLARYFPSVVLLLLFALCLLHIDQRATESELLLDKSCWKNGKLCTAQFCFLYQWTLHVLSYTYSAYGNVQTSLV